MKKLETILLLCALFTTIQTLAQQGNLNVSGKVSSSENDAGPLGTVSVTVKGTQIGTITDASGNFHIRVPDGNSILVFSYTGYKTIEVALKGRSSLQISLEKEITSLDDVVITGYTSQSKTKSSSSVARLAPEEMKNTPDVNPVQAMQGKLAGVSIPIMSGQPGAGAGNIIIRGGTKPNVYGVGGMAEGALGSAGGDESNPLVIIDGVFRSLNDINPDNIESLQVMKDAASIAIYGARGANGVIVIKTKTGRYNSKMNITVNHRTTWETQARDYDYLNAAEYLKYMRSAVATNPLLTMDQKNALLTNTAAPFGIRTFTTPGEFSNSVYTLADYNNLVAVEGQDYVDKLLAKGYQIMDDPANPGTKLIYQDDKYQDRLWKTGISSNDNVGVSGGSERANYNINFGHTEQKGVLAGTKYKRTDILGNFSFKATDRLDLDVMVNYQVVQPNYVASALNDLVRGIRLSPLTRLFRENDGLPFSGESYSTRNRFHILYYDDTRITTETYTTRVGATYKILKGLVFKPSVSYSSINYTYMFMRKGVPSDDYAQPPYEREKSQTTQLEKQLMTDQILQYDLNIKNGHHLTALAGFNYTKNNTNTVNIGSQRATNDYIFTIDEPTTTIIDGTVTSNVTAFSSGLTESKSASYFGQLLYDYQAKYLFSASLRYDGFSNFAPNNRYATFPSVSAGWNIHKEKFFHVRPISLLKLRGSWGTAGTSDLNVTDTYGGYSAGTYAYNPTVLRANLSNPDLVWEKTVMTDIAVDLGLFNNRISLTADWYNKLTENRINSLPLPSEAPFSSITYNNGTLQNRGIEIELNADIVKYRGFKWNASFAFAKNDQKIVKLPNNGRLKNRQGGSTVYDPVTKQAVEVGGYAEGERPFGIWAYKVDGVFATTAEADAWNAQKRDVVTNVNVPKTAGDFIFDDINGDNVIDQKDVVFIGYATPNITGGMQNTFTYKSFSLRFNVDFALGHYIGDGALTRSLGTSRGWNEGAPRTMIGNEIWQKEGDKGKKYAKHFVNNSQPTFAWNYFRQIPGLQISDYGTDLSNMYQKGDFLAFRELTLGYNLPKKIVKKISASGVNVFGTIYNIGYLTRYKGLNPETYTGFDPGGYPRARQFALGATVTF